MPRISCDEHATIYQRVEVSGEKVAVVAASYGCTSANIYAISAKQRRSPGRVPQSEKPDRLQESVVPPLQLPLDVEGSTGSAETEVPTSVSAAAPEQDLPAPSLRAAILGEVTATLPQPWSLGHSRAPGSRVAMP